MDIPGNTIVLDLETARSADDCRHCGKIEAQHLCVNNEDKPWRCPESGMHGVSLQWYEPIGWHNKPALGLAVGCYWDYADSRIHWFDPHTLEATVRLFVERQPLLVSFNGIGFDFPLMRGLLRQAAESLPVSMEGVSQSDMVHDNLQTLCDTFKAQCATSYDLLDVIWRTDPASKRVKGLNNLDALAQANGFGAKLSHGVQAPRDWAKGRHAEVLNYCQSDVYLTKALFEKVITEGFLLRGDNCPLILPSPFAVERG